MADYYEIVVRGYVDTLRASWFEDLTVDNLPTGEAALRGRICDDEDWAALLGRVCEMGMPLLSVKRRAARNA